MTDFELKDLCSKFALEGNFAKGTPYGSGHINDTYLIQTDCNRRYVLQRVNHEVFKKPVEVMENIAAVTEFLHEKVLAQGGNPNRETMTLVPAKDGKNYVQATDTDVYRVYLLIENAVCYDVIGKPETFYNAAKSFGNFQKLLSDFPADKLNETIPDFHNTYRYFTKFDKAVKDDILGRCCYVEKEIEFVRKRVHDTKIVTEALKNKELPLRVTHNDTKLNNVMFDCQTDEGLCVIDLDTVMPGSLLFDFGDAIRYGANTAAEDEQDLSLVKLDLELFEAFTKGYLDELSNTISPKELELLPFSAKLLTLECGIRFLTDYLVGDTYFKIHRPNHNLDRARTQFKLVEEIEAHMDSIQKIVHRTMDSLK